MNPQPKRSMDLAIQLMNSLSDIPLDTPEFKIIANKANIEAWKGYKAFPNDIESVAVYALSEGALGKISQSIKIFENEVITKINSNTSESIVMLILGNYARVLMVDNQLDKASSVIQEMRHLFNKHSFIDVIKSTHIFKTIFRIYFHYDLYLEMLELIDDIECQSKIQDSSFELFKVFIFYKLQNYTQVLNHFNKYTEIFPNIDVDKVFELTEFHISSAVGHLTFGLTDKETHVLNSIKNFINDYIDYTENGNLNNSKEIKLMIGEYDETIPDELQQQFTYTLDELLEGFNGTNHDEISTGEPIGKEVW